MIVWNYLLFSLVYGTKKKKEWKTYSQIELYRLSLLQGANEEFQPCIHQIIPSYFSLQYQFLSNSSAFITLPPWLQHWLHYINPPPPEEIRSAAKRIHMHFYLCMVCFYCLDCLVFKLVESSTEWTSPPTLHHLHTCCIIATKASQTVFPKCQCQLFYPSNLKNGLKTELWAAAGFISRVRLRLRVDSIKQIALCFFFFPPFFFVRP